MADIKLGLTGAEVTLPPISWLNGSPPTLAVGYKKRVDKATMLDGSERYNFKAKTPKSFSLEWQRLTEAQLDALIALSEYNLAMRYQNNWTDSTWRIVVITTFEWSALLQTLTSGGTPLFRASMTLEEQV